MKTPPITHDEKCECQCARRAAVKTPITHDDRCEQLPGGEYYGKTIGNPPMAIPCHCPARESGTRRAERENRRDARRAAQEAK
jgi:hypothetical protein